MGIAFNSAHKHSKHCHLLPKLNQHFFSTDINFILFILQSFYFGTSRGGVKFSLSLEIRVYHCDSFLLICGCVNNVHIQSYQLGNSSLQNLGVICVFDWEILFGFAFDVVISKLSTVNAEIRLLDPFVLYWGSVSFLYKKHTVVSPQSVHNLRLQSTPSTDCMGHWGKRNLGMWHGGIPANL